MPAQISGRCILPKSRFTFIKNVNIQNSLLWLEVVRIKKILALNLLIYIGLHCVRRSSWTLATLVCSLWIELHNKKLCSIYLNPVRGACIWNQGGRWGINSSNAYSKWNLGCIYSSNSNSNSIYGSAVKMIYYQNLWWFFFHSEAQCGHILPIFFTFCEYFRQLLLLSIFLIWRNGRNNLNIFSFVEAHKIIVTAFCTNYVRY